MHLEYIKNSTKSVWRKQNERINNDLKTTVRNIHKKREEHEEEEKKND